MSIQSISNPTLAASNLGLAEAGTQIRRPQASANEGGKLPDTQEKASPKDIAEATKKTNEFVGRINSNLQFSVDEGQTIVKVMDIETKQVIKQIPSEDMLEIARSLDKLEGLLVKQKA